MAWHTADIDMIEDDRQGREKRGKHSENMDGTHKSKTGELRPLETGMPYD